MGIQSAGRGRDTHLIKISLGYESTTSGTRKRLYYTETFKGTKKDARLREAALKIQHHDKKLVRSSEMTFSACCGNYCDEARSRLSLSSFSIYEWIIKHYLLPSIGNKKLKDLTRADFQKVYDYLNICGKSPRTVHTVHGISRVTIRWALTNNLLREDILQGIILPKLPKERPEFLTYEEMQAFFEAAPRYWYGNAFKFQFMTGLRNQELMALKWKDVNFEDASVLIRRACMWIGSFRGFKCTKTRVERTIALDTPTINFLKRLKVEQEAHINSRISRGLTYEDNNLIFCSSGGRVPDRDVVIRYFKNILKDIGITRRFRWYDVRHTHATHLLDVEGANPKMIANRMGHSVEILFRVYGHEMNGQQREALSKITSRVKL